MNFSPLKNSKLTVNATVVTDGSIFETVILSYEKVRRLKHSRLRFCFRLPAFHHFRGLFQLLDLKASGYCGGCGR